MKTKTREAREMAKIRFKEMESGEWVEKGCDKCGRGMTGRIYRFQRENRPQGTICMTCSKKEMRREMKNDL